MTDEAKHKMMDEAEYKWSVRVELTGDRQEAVRLVARILAHLKAGCFALSEHDDSYDPYMSIDSELLSDFKERTQRTGAAR